MTIERYIETEQEPTGNTGERLVHSNRLVVFGSNTSYSEYIPNLRKDLDGLGLTEVEIKQTRGMYFIPQGFYECYQTRENPNPTKSLPVGVILLPKMRQYDTLPGMLVPTYESSVPSIVKKICEENKVQLVEIYDGFTQEQVKMALRKLQPQA